MEHSDLETNRIYFLQDEVEEIMFPLIQAISFYIGISSWGNSSSSQICSEPPMLSSFIVKYGFSMDPWWPFDNVSTAALKTIMDSSTKGIRAAWEMGTSGIEDFGFVKSQVTLNGSETSLTNPNDLHVRSFMKRVNTFMHYNLCEGHCYGQLAVRTLSPSELYNTSKKGSVN